MSRPASRALRASRMRRATCCVLIAALNLSSTAAMGLPRPAQADRSAQSALAGARSQVASLGLGAGNDLVLRHHFTNAQGRTVVHADQTFQGKRVWGAQAIVHSEAWGGTRVLQQGLLADAQPAGSATLSSSRAVDIALKSFAAARDAKVQTSSELVVFPTSYMGQAKPVWNAKTGRYGFDRKASPLTVAPKDKYVWAYEVRALTHNKADGLKDVRYVVDAGTGAILRTDNGIKTLEAPNPASVEAHRRGGQGRRPQPVQRHCHAGYGAPRRRHLCVDRPHPRDQVQPVPARLVLGHLRQPDPRRGRPADLERRTADDH